MKILKSLTVILLICLVSSLYSQNKTETLNLKVRKVDTKVTENDNKIETTRITIKEKYDNKEISKEKHDDLLKKLGTLDKSNQNISNDNKKLELKIKEPSNPQNSKKSPSVNTQQQGEKTDIKKSPNPNNKLNQGDKEKKGLSVESKKENNSGNNKKKNSGFDTKKENGKDGKKSSDINNTQTKKEEPKIGTSKNGDKKPGKKINNSL